MTAAVLQPCPGCGALYPPSDGPTHRYLGASAGCFALFSWYMVGNPDASGMLAESRIPPMAAAVPPAEPSLDMLIGDAYGVQLTARSRRRRSSPSLCTFSTYTESSPARPRLQVGPSIARFVPKASSTSSLRLLREAL